MYFFRILPICIAIVIAASFPSHATMGAREGIVKAGSFPKPVNEPGKVLLDVPHIRQKPWFCVPTSSAMVLQYFGETHNPENLKENAEQHKAASRRNSNFTLWKDMQYSLRKIGHRWPIRNYGKTSGGFRRGLADIKRSLRKKNPVLIDVHLGYGHTFVVVGFDDAEQVVYIRDPNIPSDQGRQLSYRKLKSYWHNHRFSKSRSAFFSTRAN